MKRLVHAACPHDCPDGCAVLITIEDGRATKIQGDPEHPITRGFLCGKVAKYLDRVYSPDRVLYPMRRVSAKGTHGDGVFQRISWDDAFNEIVARLKKISTEFGPEAVLPYSYGGNIGVLNNGRWTCASSIAWAHRNCIAASARRRRRRYHLHLRAQDRHRARAVPPRKVHRRVGRQHPRQQYSSLAVH